MRTCWRCAARGACAALVCALAAHAQATGLQIVPQNGSGLGNAYAGAAATKEEPGAMFFNPAALAVLAEPRLSLGLTRFDASLSFSDTGSTPPGPGPFARALADDGGDAGTTTYIPAAYVSIPMTRDIAIGIGLSSPYGLSTEYDPGWRGQFLAVRSELRTIDVNAAVAIRLSDQLSFGVGASRQRLDAELSQKVNAAVFGPPDFGFRVRGHSLAWGYNLGVLYEALPTLTLGMAYRSAVKHEVRGDYAFDPGTPLPLALAAGLPSLSGPARVHVKLPATFTIAAAWRPAPRWELLADATRTGWSSIQEQRAQFPTGGADQVTPFNWRSTWRIGAGANYRLNGSWTLRGGISADRSPVPDATRSPRLPGEDTAIFAVGARLQVSRALTVNGGYNHVRSRTASVSYDGGNPTTNGTLIGSYRSRLNVIGVHMSASF